ncbi:uncharacterized protein BDZ99DRAFT_476139 [Mytilinidion resinicola]|uniref:RING-type domain-containing protein n=1 Tax=Mytilinidion resinicola TaxID=574789 RepID=A0A6A6YMW8_9PEZI|nr:uncharacterized protein BDZ99DRAFT_476139 [Mytilinidion resinicola]KAF2809899.1 hypothetical protein BDZ99DRAFT_476139 [Mytilinidion resinicola]
MDSTAAGLINCGMDRLLVKAYGARKIKVRQEGWGEDDSTPNQLQEIIREVVDRLVREETASGGGADIAALRGIMDRAFVEIIGQLAHSTLRGVNDYSDIMRGIEIRIDQAIDYEMVANNNRLTVAENKRVLAEQRRAAVETGQDTTQQYDIARRVTERLGQHQGDAQVAAKFAWRSIAVLMSQSLWTSAAIYSVGSVYVSMSMSRLLEGGTFVQRAAQKCLGFKRLATIDRPVGVFASPVGISSFLQHTHPTNPPNHQSLSPQQKTPTMNAGTGINVLSQRTARSASLIVHEYPTTHNRAPYKEYLDIDTTNTFATELGGLAITTDRVSIRVIVPQGASAKIFSPHVDQPDLPLQEAGHLNIQGFRDISSFQNCNTYTALGAACINIRHVVMLELPAILLHCGSDKVTVRACSADKTIILLYQGNRGVNYPGHTNPQQQASAPGCFVGRMHYRSDQQDVVPVNSTKRYATAIGELLIRIGHEILVYFPRGSIVRPCEFQTGEPPMPVPQYSYRIEGHHRIQDLRGDPQYTASGSAFLTTDGPERRVLMEGSAAIVIICGLDRFLIQAAGLQHVLLRESNEDVNDHRIVNAPLTARDEFMDQQVAAHVGSRLRIMNELGALAAMGAVGEPEAENRRILLTQELQELSDQNSAFAQTLDIEDLERLNRALARILMRMPNHRAAAPRPQVEIQTFTSSLGTCGICLEEYSNTHEPVIVDKCRHIFGRGCLHKHVNESALGGRHLCPACRIAMFAP